MGPSDQPHVGCGIATENMKTGKKKKQTPSTNVSYISHEYTVTFPENVRFFCRTDTIFYNGFSPRKTFLLVPQLLTLLTVITAFSISHQKSKNCEEKHRVLPGHLNYHRITFNARLFYECLTPHFSHDLRFRIAILCVITDQTKKKCRYTEVTRLANANSIKRGHTDIQCI